MSTERILIDGYNLLYATLGSADIGPSLERARTRFLDNLAAVPSNVRVKFEVVFDALHAVNPIGQRMQHHGIVVKFARDRSADDFIGREVDAVANRHSHARSLLVVSSDRAVQSHARGRGARTVGSDAFLSELDRFIHPAPRARCDVNLAPHRHLPGAGQD
jgi:predicted RNA-binding protein with PIN domain